MKTFVSAVQDIPAWAFPIIVEEMRTIGIAAGKASIKETTGKGKYGSLTTTGKLHDTFTGVTRKINKEHHRVEIGSPQEYARHAAVDTGPISQFERVQIIPHPVRDGYAPGAGWVFIGIRPFIKGHPFMEAVSESIEKELNPTITRVLQKGWNNAGQKGKGAPPTP
jgi:hypothetical protein